MVHVGLAFSGHGNPDLDGPEAVAHVHADIRVGRPHGSVSLRGRFPVTFLTMVVIPVFYSVFDSLAQGVASFWRFLTSQPAALPDQ